MSVTNEYQAYPSKLRVLSLFSGIGGIDIGLERVGMKVVAHSEIDPYASKVLTKHWPNVPNIGDISKVKWFHGVDGNAAKTPEHPGGIHIGPIDVIAGGFPCQDISLAGKGAGIKEGTRSGLWSYYAAAIRILRPRYIIVENVAALLSRGLDRVLGDLAALRYDAWWDCVPAASVGAPHRRDRVFIVATRADVASFDSNRSPMQWAQEQWSKPHGDTTGAAANRDGGGLKERTERHRRPHESQLLSPFWRDADGLRNPLADTDNSRREEQRGGGHRWSGTACR